MAAIHPAEQLDSVVAARAAIALYGPTTAVIEAAIAAIRAQIDELYAAAAGDEDAIDDLEDSHTYLEEVVISDLEALHPAHVAPPPGAPWASLHDIYGEDLAVPLIPVIAPAMVGTVVDNLYANDRHRGG